MKKENIGLAVIVGVMAVLVTINAAVYTVPEWQQAILTQFGKPIGDPITKAGLHFKLPVIWKVRRFDKRILNWDGEPNRVPTKDKKYIWVDTTARWRIVKPLLFLQTVQTETGAVRRLNGILDSATRDAVSNHNLVEAVRNSNAIIDKLKAKAEAEAAALKKSGKKRDVTIQVMEEEEVVGEIEPVAVGREALSELIIEKAKVDLQEFGIELIDVQLRRIAYEQSVQDKVYERMISERQRIAQKIRSSGLAEQSKIQGKISKDLQEIESQAYRKAQTTKGKADGKAIRIYAKAMNSDPKFYDFVRTLEAYKKAIPKDTKMILSTDNKFLELLRKR